MAPREQPGKVTIPLEYTYALQYFARGDQWRFVTTTANEVVTGLLRAKPGVTSVNLAEHGLPLLRATLSRFGSPEGWFRLVFWEGNVPDGQLDDSPARTCAVVYEEATILKGGEQVAAFAQGVSGVKPHPHLDTVLTAAEKLPAESDADIQADFDRISTAWNADEIIVLDMDQLGQRVNKILLEDSANGFTARVKTHLDETPPRVQLDMFASDSGPHIAGRPTWQPYRIAKRQDGKYALYGHEAMYRRTRGSDSTEHPVFGLHAGMDRASVLDRLGPPTRSITTDEVLSSFEEVVVVGTPPSNKEAWLYVDTPPGHEIRITITAGGRLERAEVYAQSSGTSKRIWSTDGERR